MRGNADLGAWPLLSGPNPSAPPIEELETSCGGMNAFLRRWVPIVGPDAESFASFSL